MKQPQLWEATREWPESAWTTDMPFPDHAIESGEWRGELETNGPWGFISSYRALAVETIETDTSHFDPYPNKIRIHGWCKLTNPVESGYCLEGKVSINGKKHRAFTSSKLFLVDGKLIDVAILYVVRKGAQS